MRQLLYTMFISNNRTSFHLWCMESLAKHEKVSKYYENKCSVAFHVTLHFSWLVSIWNATLGWSGLVTEHNGRHSNVIESCILYRKTCRETHTFEHFQYFTQSLKVKSSEKYLNIRNSTFVLNCRRFIIIIVFGRRGGWITPRNN